jgi:hypothetical protein
MRSHSFVQLKLGKKDGSNTAVTDATCKPVNGVSGVDCTLSGLNVTLDALKNIVTDKPAPLTVPLTYPYNPYVPVAVIPVPYPVSAEKKPGNKTLVQFTGDAGEEPDKEPAKESSKDSAGSLYGEIVEIEAKQEGKPLPRAPKKAKLENPMAGQPIDLVMRVGGTPVDLTAEAEERR